MTSVVSQFIKGAGGRLELWSVTRMERKIGRDGRTYTSRDYYDVETSRQYGYLFHQSGGGGGNAPVVVDGPYFVSGDARIAEQPNRLCCWPVDKTGRRTRAMRKRNRTRRLTTLPPYFDLKPGEDVLQWLQRTAIERDAVYCSECRDWLPGESHNLCEHVWWCDKTAWWSTPSERCNCKDKDDCYECN